ncbi:MAG: pyridoxal-5'-phosphate-dependent protein subunit beta, partial [Candidatus Limnocylindrales bacterium]
IHDVMSTDLVVDISDRATDQLDVLFNTAAGRDYLVRRRGVPEDLVGELGSLGLSSICNVVAAIKTAKQLDLGPDDAIVTIATDGAPMYATERAKTVARDFPAGFDGVAAAETFGRWVLGAGTDDMLELTRADRERIFDLGYYTWVEQQGVPLEEFEARRQPAFWQGLHELLPAWDALIDGFNTRTGLLADA